MFIVGESSSNLKRQPQRSSTPGRLQLATGSRMSNGTRGLRFRLKLSHDETAVPLFQDESAADSKCSTSALSAIHGSVGAASSRECPRRN